jgi:ornithine cyclodeaminase/alanine dehydrogenase-like protein (mu-crystallin family)
VTKVRVLNAAVIRQLLTMDRCIQLMHRAFEMVAAGEAILPIRQGFRTPDGRGLLGWMPGYIANPQWLGIKVISVYENFGTPFGSHQGMVLMFETGHGSPVAVLDARTITAIRTAAATAAATDVLAPAAVRSLGIFGYGEQAHTHLDALLRVRPFERVWIWGRNLERARQFAARASEEHATPVGAIPDARDAAQADVMCTLTGASEPFLRGAWLRPGQHLNLIGSGVPTAAEADEQVIARGRLFVDSRENAMALAGEFVRAKAQGLVTDDAVVGCVGDVIRGTTSARQAPSDITIFKSVGMACEDLMAADFVCSEAMRLDAGVLVDWS